MNRQLHYCSTSDFSFLPHEDAVSQFSIRAKNNADQLIERMVTLLYRQSDIGRLNHKMLAACEAWSVGPIGLGLVGKTGIGKTRCMYRMLRRLIESFKIERDDAEPEFPKFECRIPRLESVNDATLAKLVMASIDFDDRIRASQRLRDFLAADVLFLDDVGQSKISERVGAEIYEIVETRTSSLKPIVFTSNYRGKQLAEKFTDTVRGDAVVRRLAEFCTIVAEDPS